MDSSYSSIPEWQLPIRVLIQPLRTYRHLKDRSLKRSMLFILMFGMITSVASGLLSSLVGIDYQNPANCGGSAQIFAHWFTYSLLGETSWLRATAVFVIANETGYLLLAAISGPLLAGLAGLLMKRNAAELVHPAMAAVCYGMTPGLLLGWIPNPFFAIGILALVYQVIALWRMLELTGKQAIIIGALWLILLGLVQDAASFVFQALVG